MYLKPRDRIKNMTPKSNGPKMEKANELVSENAKNGPNYKKQWNILEDRMDRLKGHV